MSKKYKSVFFNFSIQELLTELGVRFKPPPPPWGRGGMNGGMVGGWGVGQQNRLSKKIPVCFLHFANLRPLNSMGVGVGEGVGQWDTMSKYFGLLSSILCHSKALNRTKFNPPPSLWVRGEVNLFGIWSSRSNKRCFLVECWVISVFRLQLLGFDK